KNGYVSTRLGKSSGPVIRPQNASSVQTWSSSPGRMCATGGTCPNVHAYWSGVGINVWTFGWSTASNALLRCRDDIVNMRVVQFGSGHALCNATLSLGEARMGV